MVAYAFDRRLIARDGARSERPKLVTNPKLTKEDGPLVRHRSEDRYA
jgi:hypothetical protein